MRLVLLSLVSIASAQDLFLRDPPTGIDAHVLDTTEGHGAEGVKIDCHYQVGTKDGEQQWEYVSTQTTQPSGRTDLFTSTLKAGVYRLTYKVGDYYKAKNKDSFYPEIVIHFNVKASEVNQNFHLPITLSEFGYSSYRGV
mmetsp:Transcript_1619/g.2714  ORF Transcript_1619/g.2714 Transcript_1619/m.2714 type:complete len:140 (+) Transcript_1619:60-479(+)